jgi:glycosyltransferase involved in cell wall biosynthesis
VKYLFVTADKFPPFRVDVRVLFVEELAARGHEIHWVMQSDHPRRRAGVEPLGSGLAWVGACVAGQSRIAKAIRQIQVFLHDWRALALLLRNRYDFIQVKDKFIAGAILLLAAKLTRTRFVYWLAYPFPESWLEDARSITARHPFVAWLRGHVARLLLYKLILPHADLVFVQSARMRDDISAKGIPAERMVPVPMGVSAGLLADRVGPCAPEVVGPSVLYLGSTLRVRRLEMIVRAFRDVVGVMPTATLYLIGGENEADIEFLRSEARRLDIVDRVVVTGPLPRDQAFAYVRAADVCLSPIYPTPVLDVASPTKLVEYMALGKPVIANEHPEQTLVLEASGGGLLEPWDEARFAEAMVKLLQQPEIAADMGRKGRAYVEQHRSYPVIADAVDQAYRRMLGGRSQSV